MPDIKLIVNEEDADTRLDVYLAENTPLSRTAIQKLIENGEVKVNEQRSSKKYLTCAEDVIVFSYEEKVLTDIKPKDMVVHPAPGSYDGTLVNALLYHCKELSDVNGYYRPGIIHRIDKDTSGLIVCAKNDTTHQFIAEQLKDKTCYRKYYAIVSGVIQNNEGEIDAPIGRSAKNRQLMCVTSHNSKPALTDFTVLERYGDSTLLDVSLQTGRTHQIRVHMAYINHSVVNDSKYGKKIIDETGQYLHAYFLSFIHPKTKERVSFKTDMPQYMKEYIQEKGGHFFG